MLVLPHFFRCMHPIMAWKMPQHNCPSPHLNPLLCVSPSDFSSPSHFWNKCLPTCISIDAAMVVVGRVIVAMARTLATVAAALVRRLLRRVEAESASASPSSRSSPSQSRLLRKILRSLRVDRGIKPNSLLKLVMIPKACVVPFPLDCIERMPTCMIR